MSTHLKVRVMAKGITRRTMLKMLGTLGISLPFAQHTVRAQDKKIVVIGAGASGLVAAYWLMDAGYDVTVLEARNRVGGRAWSSYDLAPYPVELGAEFIHGDNVKTWDLLAYVDQNSIDDESETDWYVYFENELWTEEEVDEEYDIEGGLEGFLMELVEAGVEDTGQDVSVASLLDYLAEDYPELETPEVRQLLSNKIANEYAGNIDDISVHSLIINDGEDDGEGDYHVENGYSALMTAIAELLDVRFNSPVTDINWSNQGVAITTQNGQEFVADRVVITLPLGVLKSNQVRFNPPLPTNKQTAIQKLGAGHVDKLILKFDEAFWDDDFGGVDTSLPTQIWWRPGIERGKDELPILTALIGGDSAKQFEAMSQADAIQAGLRDLETMFGIRNLQDKLVEGRFMGWGSDPFSLMGYSYIPVGAMGQNQVLAASVSNVLFFAGEATHEESFATVHGAIESGIRVADEIMALD